jgi:A/G-specific adenine glycosylase
MVAEALGQALASTLKEPSVHKPNSRQAFREELITWHSEVPIMRSWRLDGEPWNVLVAELALNRARSSDIAMLHQSIAEVVPSPIDLISNANRAREVFESLGLGSCFEDIQSVAEELVKSHGGRVPDSREKLLAIPGVGDYVANAVMCFAFGRPAILMDHGTERVISRLAGGRGRSVRWQLRLDLYRLAGADGADSIFNRALLDLSGLICTAGSPKCLACPVNAHCLTFEGKVG